MSKTPQGKMFAAQPEEPRIVEPEAAPYQAAPEPSAESPRIVLDPNMPQGTVELRDPKSEHTLATIVNVGDGRPFDPDMDNAPRDGTLLEVQLMDLTVARAVWRVTRRREDRKWRTFGGWIEPGSMPARDLAGEPVAWRTLEGFMSPGMLRGAA